MNNFRSGWYLIYTKPRHEKKVHEWLSDLNIYPFLPNKTDKYIDPYAKV
jgi:hypothetical protein